MFDIHWTELLLAMMVILLVVGPKDLPKVMRTFGATMRKLRGLAGEFQAGLDQIARESELKELERATRAMRQPNLAGKAKTLLDPEGKVDLPTGPVTPAAPQPQPQAKPEPKPEPAAKDDPAP